MKKFNKKILNSIFVFIIVVLLSISIIIATNTDNDILDENKEKIYYELQYLDSEIISMSNLLNDNLNINWKELQTSTEKLYNYWNSTILDLNILDLDKNALTDFGKTLDNLTISIKNNDKQITLNNLVGLYNKLTIYAEVLNYDANYTNILYAKYNLLNAYAIVEKGNWTVVYEYIVKSDNYLFTVVNSLDNDKYNQYNINQAYVAVKELENVINVKDLDVFYLKYNIAMEKIQNIQIS